MNINDKTCQSGYQCPGWGIHYLACWRHHMETFSVLLALCAGNSPVTGEFPSQRPVTRSFDVFFDLRLNKRLSRPSWGCWFETPSRLLWRHCNGTRGRAIRNSHRIWIKMSNLHQNGFVVGKIWTWYQLVSNIHKKNFDLSYMKLTRRGHAHYNWQRQIRVRLSLGSQGSMRGCPLSTGKAWVVCDVIRYFNDTKEDVESKIKTVVSFWYWHRILNQPLSTELNLVDKIEIYFEFSIIPKYCHDAGNWDLSPWLRSYYIIYDMTADDLGSLLLTWINLNLSTDK